MDKLIKEKVSSHCIRRAGYSQVTDCATLIKYNLLYYNRPIIFHNNNNNDCRKICYNSSSCKSFHDNQDTDTATDTPCLFATHKCTHHLLLLDLPSLGFMTNIFFFFLLCTTALYYWQHTKLSLNFCRCRLLLCGS